MNPIAVVEGVEAIQENDDHVNEQTAENVAKSINVENNDKIEKQVVAEKEILEEVNVDEEDPSTTNDQRSVSQQFSTVVTLDVIAVFCLATVENCPDSQLNDDYGQSIRSFLASEQHLEQNIMNTELQYLSSRSFRNSLFTHTVSVKMYVRTARLWESYIRKHLGIANYWERSNGTKIKQSRIHQK